MQELFTFDAATNSFTVNEKDTTTGTPKQQKQAQRFNEALAFTVQQARIAKGTMNQYPQFKAALETGIKVGGKKEKTINKCI